MGKDFSIAVDAMGGDDSPRVSVQGAVRAFTEDGINLVLVGHEKVLKKELKRLGSAARKIPIVHAEEVVGMDESAITPLRQKKNSSIRRCAELVRRGEAQGVVTIGNTGAAFAVAKTLIGTLPGVDRPAIAAFLPTMSGQTVLLDVGANVSAKTHQLREFAVMGHFYAQVIQGEEHPKIGLLSVGEEKGKGTDLTREVYEVLQETGLNFVGNVEGRDIFNGQVDVVVCDGFVGNAILKSVESMASLLARMLREELNQSWKGRLGSFLGRQAFEALRLRTDPNEVGAAPLLGVDAAFFVGHGSSTARGVQSSIRRAAEFLAVDVHINIRKKLAVMHGKEETLLGDRNKGSL